MATIVNAGFPGALGEFALGEDTGGVQARTPQYYFKFDSRQQMNYDPVVGPLLRSADQPLWVYDARAGGGLPDPGYWVLLLLDGSLAFDASIVTHPNLQFIWSVPDSVIFTNIPLATIQNLIITDGVGGEVAIAPYTWGKLT